MAPSFVAGVDRCSSETAASGLGVRYNTIKTMVYSTISRPRLRRNLYWGKHWGEQKRR
jgi:hypothetical protein